MWGDRYLKKEMKILNKFALLSISFLLTTAYVITPGIPQMLQEFPNQTEAQIQILVTIPALSVMIIVLFSDIVTKFLGEKTTIQIGLLLISVFGPLPIILSSYEMILASRILLGIGLSLITPLGVSLISYFFVGTEQASMMGLRSASESIGQSALTLLSGYLITFGGWRYSVLVYAIALPILILVTIYVPKIDRQEKRHQVKKTTSKYKLNKKVIFYFVTLFIVVGAYVGIRVRIPLIMEQRGIGSEIESGQILSMIPFIGLIIGIMFGQLYRLFREYLLMIGSFLMAVGCLVIGIATSYWIVFLGGFFVGVGYPLMISGTFTLVSSFALEGAENFTISIILSGINVGAFLAPYLLQWIGAWTGSTSLMTPFYVYAGLLTVFGVLSYVSQKQIEKTH